VFTLRRRSRILAELLRAVAAMRAELVTRLTPVPELISRVAAQSAEPVAGFFRAVEARLPSLGELSLFELWQSALGASPELMLTPQEYAAFCEIPRALGRYDIAEQRAALMTAERELERFARLAEDKRLSDSKTRAFTGVAAGIFVVLMLI
jgi:stage III sporulation protein AB